MLTPRSNLTRRVLAALDASPSRIPVLVGGCGSGRTTLLQQLKERLGRTGALYLDVERSATTPERFLKAIVASSPFPISEPAQANARAAFDTTLGFLSRARSGSGEPVTILLDEFLELRTFESFPGLRRVLHELVDGLSGSGNRFVLTSRYVARTLRLLRDRSARFEVIHMPAMTTEDTLDVIARAAGRPGKLAEASLEAAQDADYLARTVQALADGRPAYVRALAEELAGMRAQGRGGPKAGDPIGALAALMDAEGRLAKLCHFTYELRLHRARGYGALKAILEILGEDEGLTLTEISQRLQRTPGSTKDYLSWLEDVDLVTARQKRYSYTDPLLRAWVRLHCRATAPTEDDLAREVHRYALPRLPQQQDPQSAPAETAYAMTASPSGIIEID
jgi:Winged helix-turn-helix DNA-binding